MFQSRLLTYAESIPAALVGVAESELSKLPEAERRTLPAMHFGLIDDRTFNCYATSFNQRYFIGISALVPFALLEGAAFFFARSGFYPNIGDPKAGPSIVLDGIEAPPLFQLTRNSFSIRTHEGLTSRESAMLAYSAKAIRDLAQQHYPESGERLSVNDYFKQFDVLLDMLMPTCVVRREHCRYLATVILHFFWFHEIAHVTQGHLRSLKKDDELLTLWEFSPDETLPKHACHLNGITTLALEFDADIEAILMTLGIIMMDIDIDTDEFPYADRYQRVELFTLYLVVVFQILANEEARSPGVEATHPPANMRLLNMLDYLLNLASNDEKLLKSIQAGIVTASQYAKMPDFEFLRGLLDEADTYFELWKPVEQQRSNLINAYDYYAYGNLRPIIVNFLDSIDFLHRRNVHPTKLSKRSAESRRRKSS